MGRKHRVDTIHKTIRGRQLGLRHRVEISTIEDRARQDEIIAFANRIQALAELQVQDGSIPDDMRQETAATISMRDDELQQKIDHFIAYHKHFPDEHPANAFTPVQHKQTRSEGEETVGSDIPPKKHKLIKRRPHINTVSDLKQRQTYLDEAWEYYCLNTEEDLYGRVLPGNLTAVAKKLGVTRDWVEKQRKHLRAYHEAYPDDPLGTSIVPLKRGRQKGRLQGCNVTAEVEAKRQEIIQDVEDAFINLKWYSRDGDINHSTERYSLVEDNLIGPRMVFQLIKKKYGDIVSEVTIWRIINDARQRNPTRIHAAREDINDARQNDFPYIDNDVSGSGVRIQIDIRPLPQRAKIEDRIDTTVYVAWVLDDYSRAILAYDVITRKIVGPDGEIDEVDFTCKMIRLLIARLIIKTGRRPRIIYTDKGTQFAEALRKYMTFLAAPGEDPTILIHRRGARGGGKVERNLQLIDEFLKTQGGHVRTNYRRSYKRTKTSKLKTFAEFKTNFDTFVHHWNYDLAPDESPSRWQIWEGGANKTLSPPSAFNLLSFASGESHILRQWDGGAFNIDNEKWFPAEPSVELYEKLADAQKRKDEVPIIVGVVGDETSVFFKVTGDDTWHEAVRKGARRQSDRKHQKVLDTLEHEIRQGNHNRAADFFERTIRGDASRPLVLDGLSRTRGFIYPGEKLPYAQEPSQREPSLDEPDLVSGGRLGDAPFVERGERMVGDLHAPNPLHVDEHLAESAGDNLPEQPPSEDEMDVTPSTRDIPGPGQTDHASVSENSPEQDASEDETMTVARPISDTSVPTPETDDGMDTADESGDDPNPPEPPKRKFGFITSRRKA